MSRVHYFAFGSNMSSARFLTRVPLARSVGRARLDGWRFTCDKLGMDGSAKANILRHEGAFVWGVVFIMPAAALPDLDAIEGGYERVTVEVEHERLRKIESICYASKVRAADTVPHAWYKRHIVTGAVEHGLPTDYIAFLRALPQHPR